MTQLIVVSHNTFWFQGAPFPTDRPPAPDDEILKRLCAIYRQVDPDIICLQEIQNKSTFEAVSERLGMPGCYCPGTKLPQYGGAVLWRHNLARPIRDSQESGFETQRMWQVVEVQKDGCRLQIANVHLPSERQLGPERAAAQRQDELQDLVRSCERDPDMIVGDFNEQTGGSTGEFMESHGYADAAVLSARADRPTNISDGRGDYAWIGGRACDCELTYDVAAKRDLACGDSGKEYLSDHLPLWIAIGNHER